MVGFRNVEEEFRGLVGAVYGSRVKWEGREVNSQGMSGRPRSLRGGRIAVLNPCPIRRQAEMTDTEPVQPAHCLYEGLERPYFEPRCAGTSEVVLQRMQSLVSQV